MKGPSAETAFRAALAIEGGDALPELRTTFRDFAAPFGYDRFVMFSTATATDPEKAVGRIYWIEGDWFGDAEGRVDAETYVRRCPVTRHVLAATESFYWTKTASETGEFYRMVRRPRGPGLHGMQIPVFGPLGLEGAMSLGGLRIDSSPPARLALSMVATAAFRTARRLLDDPEVEPLGRLSAREREVLSWTAAGRRQVEIAAVLRLSERTVENHLRRIRKRLGVATTGQAIRVAIRNGEIES